MQKLKKIIPYVVITILLITSIIGYTTTEEGTPFRVLFMTKGGDVIFSHKAHYSTYRIGCRDCHHGSMRKDPATGWNCRSCHKDGTGYDGLCSSESIHKQCIGATCSKCHQKTFNQEESKCNYCHR